MSWVYTSFGIIAPTVNNNICSKQHLSISATSLYDALYKQHRDNESNLDMFSTSTLKNIINIYDDGDGDYDTNSMSREDMLNTVYAFIDNELDAGYINPKYHCLWNLSAGIFISENWKYLSDDDFWNWASSYGYQGQEKDDAINFIIAGQNSMLKEIHKYYADDFKVRGVDIINLLIQ